MLTVFVLIYSAGALFFSVYFKHLVDSDAGPLDWSLWWFLLAFWPVVLVLWAALSCFDYFSRNYT